MGHSSFGYLRLFIDPIRFGNMEPKRITMILYSFNGVVNTKTSIIQMGPNIFNVG